MVNVRHYKPTGDMLDAQAPFQQQWQLYRKFVDNNYFYHREVYGQLHRILVDEAVQPFRFLDIACGDARATVDALADRPLISLPTFLELWDVAYYPAQDCARGDADAEFQGQLGQIPVTKLKAQIPPYT